MKKCSFCGHENFDENNFCENCGNELELKNIYPENMVKVIENKNICLPKKELYFNDKCAIASFVLALMSIPFFFALPFSVIAMILAVKGTNSEKYRFAAIGMGISAVTILVGIIVYLIIFTNWNNIINSPVFEGIINAIY